MRDILYISSIGILNLLFFFMFSDNIYFLLALLVIESIVSFKSKALNVFWQKSYPIFLILRAFYCLSSFEVVVAAGLEFCIITSNIAIQYYNGMNTCFIYDRHSFKDRMYDLISGSYPYVRALLPIFLLLSLSNLTQVSLLVILALLPIVLVSCTYIQYGKWSKPRPLDDFISTYEPEVIMYVCGVQGGNYQLEQWLKTLEKLHRRVLIVVREKFWLDSASKTTLPMAYAKRMIDVERLMSPRTKVCLYPANGIKNAHMMRRTELKHIFINHGESDKVVNTSKFLNAYDMWYLAGIMAKERMESAGFNLNNNNYRLIGRPPLSLKIDNAFTEPDMVLYAPTWEGFDDNACYSSIVSHGRNLIADLIRNEIPFIFKPHPLTGHVKKEFKKELFVLENMVKKSDNGTLAKEDDILDLMNRSSFLVTDISSVMNDYLQTGKPFFVTNPSSMAIEDFNREFKTTQAAYIYEIGQDFSTILQKVVTFDSMSKVRKEVKESSLGPDTPTAFEIFSSCIEEEF